MELQRGDRTIRAARRQSSWRRKHFALPAEHGAWAMFLGPFAVGLGVAWRWNASVAWALLAMLALFLARQPMIILVKALTGRRSRNDIGPAAGWMIFYGLLAALFAALLVVWGRVELLALALLALPPMVWQLWLVTRREERQMTVELAGSGALALAAPAAYYAAVGHFDRIALAIWLLCWLQSAAAIVYVYMRLAQRRMTRVDTRVPSRAEQWALGWRPVLYHAINLLATLVPAGLHVLPPLVPVAFAAMLAEALRGTFRPAVGVKPQVLGVSQVAVTVLFVGLLVLAYRVG